MSDDQWKVHLIFQDAKSNKFWRARIEDDTLYVNYGRIGANGQTQVKELGSLGACEKELAKLETSKRKKGYVDAEAEGGVAADEAEAVAEGPVHVDLALESPRKVELRLTHDGDRLRTVVVETYGSAAEAAAALKRLRVAMSEEGYKKVATRADL